MKKSLLILAIALGTILTATAKYEGPSYYRIKNYATSRYLYVLDNKADVDYTATTVDMNGVELWRGEERMISDPATIVYVTEAGSGYDILAQGTGIYAMSGIYLSLRYDANRDAYLAYGSQSGVTKYLGDPSTSRIKDQSYLKDSASGDYRYWHLIPVDENSDNYFGLKPTAVAAGQYFASIFADFPFTPASKGVEIYTVSAIDTTNGVAIIAPITDGVVNNATPVIVKCVSDTPADNKLKIAKGTAAPVKANLLKGNYFNNDGKGGHLNQTAFNKATMRVLGVTKDGKVGFIVSPDQYLARNSAYLSVPAGTPDELTAMTQEEYTKQYGGVNDILADSPNATSDVYNTLGVKVRSNATSLQDLPAGIYIWGGKKHIVK